MRNWREQFHDLSLAGIEMSSLGLSLDLMRLEPDQDAEEQVTEAGLYVGCADFMDVCRGSQQIRTARNFPRKFYNEPTIGLFHTLVLHLCPIDFKKETEQELRYNPGAHSSSNTASASYQYWMLMSALEPLSYRNVAGDNKIEGVGSVGRQLLRIVLFGTGEV